MIEISRITNRTYSETLARIMISAWRSGFPGILPNETIVQYTQFEPCAAMFSQILSSGVGSMYLAELDGQPMGLLYWLPESETEARIEALLTIPEAWGNGVGAALMERAITDAQAGGFTTLRVWPFAENRRAQRFYQKHGFVPSGATRQGDAFEMEYIRSL